MIERTSPQAPVSPAVLAAAARVAGILAILAGLALGIRAFDVADADNGWLFVMAALTPATFGFLLLAAAERIQSSSAGLPVDRVCLAAGLMSIGGALALAIKFTTEAESDEIWAIIGSLTVLAPVVPGVLLIASTLPVSDSRLLGAPAPAAMALAVASAAGAIAFSVWSVNQGDTGDEIWVILAFCTAPTAAAAVLFGASRPADGAVTGPWPAIAGGAAVACVIAAVATGIWYADRLESMSVVWTFVAVTILALALAFLALSASHALPRTPGLALLGMAAAAAALTFALKLTGNEAFFYVGPFATGAIYGSTSSTLFAVAVDGNDAWIFLSVMILPVAVGLLQAVVSMAPLVGPSAAKASTGDRGRAEAGLPPGLDEGS